MVKIWEKATIVNTIIPGCNVGAPPTAGVVGGNVVGGGSVEGSGPRSGIGWAITWFIHIV